MTSRRILKVASAIREVVSMCILTQIRDPRVSNVTVTFVEVAGDMRQAKVHVSIMGDEKEQQLCMHGLQSSTGFLQQKVADRIDTRYTPKLKFVLDEGIKMSAEVNRILGELRSDDNGTDDEGTDDEGTDGQEQEKPQTTDPNEFAEVESDE